MKNIFLTATPEELGISSVNIENFLTRLEDQNLPIHSAIIMRHDKICSEIYYQPYNRETLHRMFSITKSFVSLGIGLLEEEGKLSLDDHIIDYFPEKLPENGAFPYMKMLTIRDMLAMRTCHNKTTYKADGINDWVGSFFTVEPNHVPGTNFSYDTSSTHVLGALVEKLSGTDLLSYLRLKFLDEMDFSKDAYVLKDPCGVSMGGSGLCATPYDILKVIYLIAHNGQWNGKQLLPESYIRESVKKHSDTYAKQSTLEEIQGYGYQIWMTRNNGFVLFGMGGQLALYVPEKDIFMVTTADAQGRQGGVQLIYDAFWDEIYNHIQDEPLPADANALEHLKEFSTSRKLFVLDGEQSSSYLNQVNHVNYMFEKNPCGISQMCLDIDESDHSGCVRYTNATGNHVIDFKIGANAFGMFPDYDLKYAASGAWRTSDSFLIKIQIIDSAIGNLYFSLNFKENYLTVMFRKIEESLFKEYDGVFSGKKAQ